MPTYVAMYRFTDEGARNIRQTVERAQQTRAENEQRGFKVHALYWTQGEYDLVAVHEFPGDETATAFVLATAMLGNVRTQTLRAFGAEEMRRILQKLPPG